MNNRKMLKGIADGSLKKKMRRLSKNLQTLEKRKVEMNKKKTFEKVKVLRMLSVKFLMHVQLNVQKQNS